MNKLKLALLGPYPAQACLRKEQIKPARRAQHPHPVPWIKSVCGELAIRGEVEARLFVHSRARGFGATGFS